MIRTHCIVGIAMLLAAGAAAGDETAVAGMVKTVRGVVNIERAGGRLPATVGTPLYAADRVRTGEDGSVGITLRDNTLLSAGPNARLSLDRFMFDQTTHGGSLIATVARGTLAVVTGKLARQNPESVEFHTPTSVLGVRGTEFAVEVSGGSDE